VAARIGQVAYMAASWALQRQCTRLQELVKEGNIGTAEYRTDVAAIDTELATLEHVMDIADLDAIAVPVPAQQCRFDRLDELLGCALCCLAVHRQQGNDCAAPATTTFLASRTRVSRWSAIARKSGMS
jgi:hypothetical protein